MLSTNGICKYRAKIIAANIFSADSQGMDKVFANFYKSLFREAA